MARTTHLPARLLVGVAVVLLFGNAFIGLGQESKKPASPAWVMDLAKMKVPEAKVSGKLKGEDFVLDEARMQGTTLHLRQGKDFFADGELVIFLFLKEGESVEGKSFRITPKSGFGSPHVHLNWKAKGSDGLPKTEIHFDKYFMLLEFGKVKDGGIPGKIYACFPDKEKSVVAGTFTIGGKGQELTGSLIGGKITLAGKEQQYHLSAGCLGKNSEGKLEGPWVGFAFSRGDESMSASSTNHSPRDTTLAWDKKLGLTHRHVNRPPGHYLVFVRGRMGKDETNKDDLLFDAKWIELKEPGGKANADLTVDPARLGKAEVSLPAGGRDGYVVFMPLDAKGELPLPDGFQYMTFTLGVKAEGGKAVHPGLREGKYRVRAGDAVADVEVKRGQTAKVELK